MPLKNSLKYLTHAALSSFLPHLFLLFSGLDSSAALQLTKLLRSIALSGRTVVLSIHQPRNEILNLFDRILLMRAGELLFFGDIKSAVDEYKVPGLDIGSELLDAISGLSVADTIDSAQRERAVTKLVYKRNLSVEKPDKEGRSGEVFADIGALRTASSRAQNISASCSPMRISYVLLRCFRHDFALMVRLGLMILVINGLMGIFFMNFELKDAIHIIIYVSIVNICFSLDRLLVEQKQMAVSHAQREMQSRELRQGVYSVVDCMFVAIIRDSIFLVCLLLPCSTQYFAMDIGRGSDINFVFTGIIIIIGCAVGSFSVMGLYNIGWSLDSTMVAAQGMAMCEAFLSGVIIPMHMFPGWFNWIRYLLITFHVTQSITYVNLVRAHMPCTDELRLEVGSDNCFTTTNSFALLSAGVEREGMNLAVHILAVGLIATFWLTLSLHFLHRKVSSQIKRHDTTIPLLEEASDKLSRAHTVRRAGTFNINHNLQHFHSISHRRGAVDAFFKQASKSMIASIGVFANILQDSRLTHMGMDSSERRDEIARKYGFRWLLRVRAARNKRKSSGFHKQPIGRLGVVVEEEGTHAQESYV